MCCVLNSQRRWSSSTGENLLDQSLELVRGTSTTPGSVRKADSELRTCSGVPDSHATFNLASASPLSVPCPLKGPCILRSSRSSPAFAHAETSTVRLTENEIFLKVGPSLSSFALRGRRRVQYLLLGTDRIEDGAIRRFTLFVKCRDPCRAPSQSASFAFKLSTIAASSAIRFEIAANLLAVVLSISTSFVTRVISASRDC